MPLLHVVFALVVVTLWGGNFIAAKYQLFHLPPFFATGLRFVLVALLVVWWVKIPTRRELKAIALLSMLATAHFSLPYVGMSMGLNISSTAIVAQMGVPFSCLLGAIMLSDRLGKWRLSGMVIAFFGMSIVLGSPNALDHPLAFMLTLAGAFFWGLSNIVMKMEHVEQVNVMQMLGWMSLLAAPQLLFISAVLEPGAWQTLETIPMSASLGLLYTVVLSTLVAHGLWYFLIKSHPITYIAPYSLMVPVLGTWFASIFFGEQITWHILLGGLITLAGVAIIVIRRPKIVAHGEAT
jgi:O-acetylserine/cysteine efflux transporter